MQSRTPEVCHDKILGEKIQWFHCVVHRRRSIPTHHTTYYPNIPVMCDDLLYSVFHSNFGAVSDSSFFSFRFLRLFHVSRFRLQRSLLGLVAFYEVWKFGFARLLSVFPFFFDGLEWLGDTRVARSNNIKFRIPRLSIVRVYYGRY